VTLASVTARIHATIADATVLPAKKAEDAEVADAINLSKLNKTI
jgi:hypothetical protein